MVSWVLGIVLQLGERNSGSPTLSYKDFIVGNVYFVVLASCCGNNQIETGFFVPLSSYLMVYSSFIFKGYIFKGLY